MNINFLLFSFILIIQCKSQVICGSRPCKPHQFCSNSKTCQKSTFPDPNSLLSVFASKRDCTDDPCASGFSCVNKQCVQANSLVGWTRKAPTKKFTKGVLDREACLYAMYYCDQNIYHICENFPYFKTENSQGYAVVITNPQANFTMRQQKLGQSRQKDYELTWNFHVIFIWKTKNKTSVYDFDSWLPWGDSFKNFFGKSFKPTNFRPPYFRIMTCSNYAHQYSSTRSGALGKISGGYYRYDSPPPTPYFIVNKNGLNNTLRHMLNVYNNDRLLGTVKNLSEIYAFFGQ